MLFETLSAAKDRITFEHTGLRPLMALEYLPANRLGHAVRRTCERLVYEQYRGHTAFVFTREVERAATYLIELTGEGSVARLLLGSLHIRRIIKNTSEAPEFEGAFGYCLDCHDFFGQVAEGTDMTQGSLIMSPFVEGKWSDDWKLPGVYLDG